MYTHTRASAYARTTRLRHKATRKDKVQLYLRRQRKRSSSKASHFICWKKTTQNTAHHHTLSPFDTHSAVHSADATTRGPLYGRQPDHDRQATLPLACSPPQPEDKPSVPRMQEFLYLLSSTATSAAHNRALHHSAQLLAKAPLLEIDFEAAAGGIFDGLLRVVVEIVVHQAASMGYEVRVKGP